MVSDRLDNQEDEGELPEAVDEGVQADEQRRISEPFGNTVSNEVGTGEADYDSNLEPLKKELLDARDRYLRVLADFENFKKRSIKERADLLKYQGDRIFVDMLDVLDNLELALGHSASDPDRLRTGLEMIHKLFLERLSKWEVRGESGIGMQFDPEKHSAISRVKSPDSQPGTIVGELKEAYFYKDRLLRHAEVVVAGEGNTAG